MADLTIGQKAQRVLQLMLGLRSPRVAAALKAHGFDDAERDKGYELLRGLTNGRLNIIGGDAARPIAELDQWENKWFPIADAVLQAHYPKAREEVFLNLTQTSGPQVVVSVGTFLDRVAKQPKAVKDILAKRGLSDELIEAARGWIHQFNRASDEPRNLIDEQADAANEAALWNWYLEWSTIVRKTVSDRRLLRQLGFLRTPSGEVVEAPLDDEDEPTVGGPTPAQPGQPGQPGQPPVADDPNSPFRPG